MNETIQCEAMTYGRSFARCTRTARYLVGQEWTGHHYGANDRLLRYGCIVEFWGVCYQHREAFRAYGERGSDLDDWKRIDPYGAGVFNGRRLGWVGI